jgi:hypothetical protein
VRVEHVDVWPPIAEVAADTPQVPQTNKARHRDDIGIDAAPSQPVGRGGRIGCGFEAGDRKLDAIALSDVGEVGKQELSAAGTEVIDQGVYPDAFSSSTRYHRSKSRGSTSIERKPSWVSWDTPARGMA